VSQLSLILAPTRPVAPEPKEPQTIEERYAAFSAEHPEVLAELLRLARARLDRGERYIGAKALWEELRRSLAVQRSGAYKLNNNFTAAYARELVAAEPRLAGVIRMRRRQGESE